MIPEDPDEFDRDYVTVPVEALDVVRDALNPPPDDDPKP